VKLFLGTIIFIVILYAVKYLLNMLKPAKGGSIGEAISGTISGGSKWMK
jgi:hypothetical protein